MMKKILIRSLVVIITLVLFLSTYIYIFAKNAKKITVGTTIENYEKDNYALLVIDVQEATTGDYSTNEYYKANSEELIIKINKLIEKFDSKDATVIYVQNQIDDKLINLFNNTYAKGSESVKLDKRLNIISDHIISKSRQDAFSNPELDKILIEHKVNKIFVVGLDAAYCVNSTIQAAQSRNYKITVIDKAVLSESEAKHDKLITQYKSRGVEVLSFTNTLPI